MTNRILAAMVPKRSTVDENPEIRPSSKSILFVTKTREFGGAEKHLLELIRRLPGRVRVSILCLEADFYTPGVDPRRVEVVTRETALKSFGSWFRFFQRMRPDVVVFVRAVPWTFDWYTPVAARLAGIPRRVSIAHLPPPPAPAKGQGWSMESISRRFKRTRRLLSWRVSAFFEDATICVSDAIRDILIGEYRFSAEKTITVHNGVSLSEFDSSEDKGLDLRSRLALGSEGFLLVCVARLSEQKRIDILLSGVARALQNGVRCKCIIVGDGPLREELEEKAQALGLSGCVFFEGFREDVRPYLRAATAFVLTSRREGMPLAILEAMACGLPCIVTRVGGNCEVVTHGITGLVVNPGSIDEVADAISYLATHPQERAEMSRLARLRVHEEFNIDDRMAQIRDVILA